MPALPEALVLAATLLALWAAAHPVIDAPSGDAVLYALV
jgi:hypothetical protein